MGRLNNFRERTSVSMEIGVLLALVLLLAATNIGAVYYYQSQVDTLGNSINHAGEQRMLSQRMAYTSFMIAQGHEDQTLLNDSIDRFNENLDGIANGGTIDGDTLEAAPGPVEDELQVEREAWTEFEKHATIVASMPAHNESFQESLQYLLDNRATVQGLSEELVSAYESEVDMDGSMEEFHVARHQQLVLQEIAALTLEISRHSTKPGEEAAVKADIHESSELQDLKANLSAKIAEFDEALTALDTGGTFSGTSLDPAPASVQQEISDLRDAWEDYRDHASTVATTPRLNPEFWDALSYVEDNNQDLKEVSDDVVTSFNQVSNERISRMKSLLFVLFGVDVVLIALGLVMSRRFISKPIAESAEIAETIAGGSFSRDLDSAAVDSDVPEEQRRNEISQLQRAFADMQSYLQTAAAQADALADQEFDAAVLDEDLPGEFGDSLTQMQDDLERLITDIETAKDEAETARAEAEALSASLERKAQEFSDVMTKAAEGDLTARLDTDSDTESMRAIAQSFNAMMNDIESTLGEIQLFAQEVAAASEEATAGAEEVTKASEQVSESIQEISDGAQKQTEKHDRVSSEMNQLSATIEEAASAAQTVSETSRETADVAENGERTAEQAIEEIQAVQETMDETVDNVEELDALMAQIGEIVDLISDIAEQTNMLALNANIEAARAGNGDGAGDGFGVVADEVKQLAEETQESAADVGKLIANVQDQTDATVNDIRWAEERVRETTEAVEEAVDAFARVAENVAETDNGVQEISDALDNQAESAEETVAMIDDVVEISQQTSTESRTVSAAAQEQASSMSQVTSNVESLTEQAEQLQTLLDRFDVSDERSEPEAASKQLPAEDQTGAGGVSPD